MNTRFTQHQRDAIAIAVAQAEERKPLAAIAVAEERRARGRLINEFREHQATHCPKCDSE